ncbi:MAG: DTW domain-containing protein [Gammaproteobacteria bacterium]|nr:DTW domain-containing protein [Gammaproteobacteria bacterium]
MPREICEGCQRPQAVCLCPHLVSLKAPCELVILQHPSEQKQALATVPILKQCISPIDVWVGEDFSGHPKLQALLEKPQTCRILFPSEESDNWSLDDPALAVQANIQYLIIIDGTWRKAKRIWHMNPWLHELPCAQLTDIPKTQYQIRSSSIEGGVSTLEAVSFACEYLTGSNTFRDLMKPFKAMIDMQIKKMGQEVFLAHYQKQD